MFDNRALGLYYIGMFEDRQEEKSIYYPERKTGNGVLTKIGYDPLRQRPDTLVTYLKDQTVEQSLKYEYDPKGNIASITDLLNESRNQSFEYDHLNRVTRALGKYGEENYSYHRNGNLLSKGAFNYSYENPNHIHAVTRVNSPNTGIVGYSYDVMGNMIGRNGDSMHYNAQNKLARIDSMGGDRFEYTYDHSGMRIKKSLQNSNTVTYSFGNLYEIHRSPGVEEKHTLYVNGIEGDMIAQYSRNDALLVNQLASNEWLVNPFCKDLTVDCDTYWKNRIGFTFIKFLEDTNVYVNGKLEKGHRAIPWIIILALMFLVVYKTKEESRESEGNEAIDFFGISILPKLSNSLHKQIPRYGTALLVVVFSFTSTVGCFPLLLGGGEGESGTPIWLLGVGGGVPVDTPSVGNEPSGGGIGGGSSSGTARISGMYFFHPDHLGSITMITDGNGNVLAGGERGGKSHITYKPYGEILRTDSYGPDIAKFKYTGQEEDKESGLYYYKARFYDAALGRFASNDGMVMPKKPQGMNRMMYVEGNPIKWSDISGNNISTPLAWAIVGYVSAPSLGISREQGFFLGAAIGYRFRDKQRRGNDLDRVFKTGNMFEKMVFKVDLKLFGDRIWHGIKKAFSNKKSECDYAGFFYKSQPDPSQKTNTGGTGLSQPASPGSQTTTGNTITYVVIEAGDGSCQITVDQE